MNVKIKTCHFTTQRTSALFWPLAKTGGLGFEPRQTDSESAVLPLHHPPRVDTILNNSEHLNKRGAAICRTGRAIFPGQEPVRAMGQGRNRLFRFCAFMNCVTAGKAGGFVRGSGSGFGKLFGTRS